jgi:iron complex outermembrane receptor protein
MNRLTKAAVLGATALAAGVVAAPALAQQPDVITVTAQKREQTLQETPVSVAVVTDTAIQQSQIRDAADLQTLVPISARGRVRLLHQYRIQSARHRHVELQPGA